MIYVDQPTMYIPAEGQRSMLELARAALCLGCPEGVGPGDPAAAPPVYEVWAVLGTIDAPIVASLRLPDIGPLGGAGGQAPHQLNDETPPDYCLGMIEGPDLGVDALWRLVIDQQVWNFGVGSDPQVLYGWAIAIVEAGGNVLIDGRILAYGRFSAPPVSVIPGDAVKLTAEIIPCLCLPPAIPEVPE